MALIYHYCNPQTFLKIIENKEIWLSSTNNMNDSAEGHWYKKSFDDVITALSNDESEGWCESARERFQYLYMPKYIACFSKNSDSLSQWRAYAQDGEGVAIGFEDSLFDIKGDMAIPLPIPEFSITLQDVEYKELNEISVAINEIAEKYKKEFGSNFSEVARLTARECASLMWRTKNPAFKEEEEKRIIYSPMMHYKSRGHQINIVNPIGSLKHRLSGKMLTSHFEFEVSNKSIVEVVLGPKNVFTEYDTTLFLGTNACEHVEIKKSKATYR